jgi:hypothetical protein
MPIRFLTVIALLLIVIPLAAFADATTATRAFLDGQHTTFSTKGHPKGKGVNFTIAYPSSWRAAEGERPNVVQKFVGEDVDSVVSVMIITKELPLPPGTVITKQEQEELFAPSELRGMLPPGATFVNAQSTEIEANPAGIIEYTMRVNRAGMSMLVHAWTLNFLQGHTLVQVQFQVGGMATSEVDVARRMTAYKPLFTLIANTIVFPEKWTASPGVESAPSSGYGTTSSLPYDDPSMLILTLVVSFLITWGLGLTPPLVIRYAIVRRPLTKKTASWIAAGFSAFFWLAFLALNNALGEKPGTGVVWIIMFFVARWIMSRGHVPEPQSAVEAPASALKRGRTPF